MIFLDKRLLRTWKQDIQDNHIKMTCFLCFVVSFFRLQGWFIFNLNHYDNLWMAIILTCSHPIMFLFFIVIFFYSCHFIGVYNSLSHFATRLNLLQALGCHGSIKCICLHWLAAKLGICTCHTRLHTFINSFLSFKKISFYKNRRMILCKE